MEKGEKNAFVLTDAEVNCNYRNTNRWKALKGLYASIALPAVCIPPFLHLTPLGTEQSRQMGNTTCSHVES